MDWNRKVLEIKEAKEIADVFQCGARLTLSCLGFSHPLQPTTEPESGPVPIPFGTPGLNAHSGSEFCAVLQLPGPGRCPRGVYHLEAPPRPAHPVVPENPGSAFSPFSTSPPPSESRKLSFRNSPPPARECGLREGSRAEQELGAPEAARLGLPLLRKAFICTFALSCAPSRDPRRCLASPRDPLPSAGWGSGREPVSSFPRPRVGPSPGPGPGPSRRCSRRSAGLGSPGPPTPRPRCSFSGPGCRTTCSARTARHVRRD
ncbi:decreased expression in renal and prostate cancer protein-like [Antechinus flavipes]|uniref:decreased expression in renal and prostate cancer protein-like n=1 Tax=Antechinus flavipes TaxID=38775 RepID=UPI0022357857|nr:decreased expression in renal and prostate cancer protein-like [Antechinus flavipes]